VLSGTYLAGKSSTGTRGNYVYKLKKFQTEEFKIVGFTSGKKGKSSNAIIWVLETPDGKSFKVTYDDVTLEQQKDIYTDCLTNFDTKYKNKMMTVRFPSKSEDGVPLCAKALTIRDYE
jgi:ATP-dependent DNA ligase